MAVCSLFKKYQYILQKTANYMEEMHFYEVQKFSKNWLWYLQLLIIIGLSFVFIYQVVLGKQFGSKPASNGTIILMNFLVIIIFIFFNSLALYT